MHFPDKFTVEVAVDSLDSALLAARAGATRLELCSALSEGGLTPSFSLMQEVCSKVKIPVHVMVRPRRGDFLYSESEFHQMEIDIRHARMANASGVVFGCLLPDGSVDMKQLTKLIQLARPMKITFHRAFDMAAEPMIALEALILAGVNYLLTSGQCQVAEDGFELLRELIKRSAGRMKIIAGSGVNASNIALLAGAGISHFHFTCSRIEKSKMTFLNPNLVSMGSKSQISEYEQTTFDHQKMAAVIQVLNTL